MQLEIEKMDIENFDEIKETILKYLGDLKAYYTNKFKMIQDVMSKQDADTDSMNAEFRIIEKITMEKLDVNEKSLEKIKKFFWN